MLILGMESRGQLSEAFSQDGINWLEPGTLTTDSNGGYSYTSTVPDYPGTYYGYVSYNGNETYQGCAGSHYLSHSIMIDVS